MDVGADMIILQETKHNALFPSTSSYINKNIKKIISSPKTHLASCKRFWEKSKTQPGGLDTITHSHIS